MLHSFFHATDSLVLGNKFYSIEIPDDLFAYFLLDFIPHMVYLLLSLQDSYLATGSKQIIFA